MATKKRIAKIHNVLKNRQPKLTVVLENIHDPHNVSAIFRTCEAVGIEQIHLLYTIESFPEIGKKSSGSAKKWIDVIHHHDHFSAKEVLKSNDLKILATYLSNSSTSLYETDLSIPTAIIFGNEHRGVSEDTLQIADENIYIPMFGMIESLNVSVAAAVILFEACRQRLLKNMYPYPEDRENWLNEQMERWKRINIKS